MMKSALLATVVLSVMPVAAAGADWTLNSQFTEALEASDNYFLSPNPIGGTYVSNNFLKVGAVARSPTARLEMGTDLAYRAYGGPGSDLQPNVLEGGAKTRFEKQTDALTKWTIGASWHQRDAVRAQLIDIGAVAVGGTITTSTAEGGFSRVLTSKDSIVFSTRGTFVRFSSSATSSYDDLLTSVDWAHHLTPTTDWTTSFQYERMAIDNATDTQTNFGRVMTGLRSQLSPRLTFKGTVGAGVVNVLNGAPFPTAAPTASSPFIISDIAPPVSGTSGSFLTDLLLSYRLTKTTELSFFTGQTIAPNILGGIQKTSNVGATLHHDINHRSSITMSSTFARQSGLGGTTADVFSSAVTYSYRLTRQWHTQLAYKYLERSDDVRASSNTVLLSVTRDYTILP